MKKKILLFISLTLVFFVVKSQNTGVELDEIIIQNEGNANNASTAISYKKGKVMMPKMASDVLKNIPGMTIVKRSGFSIEPMLRMFKNEQLNLMIDGGTKITHSCANRMDAMTTRISAMEIEEVEVIKGPYSVRYGQSFGGLINIISVRPKKTDDFKLSGAVDLGYETNGNGQNTGLFLSGTNKKADFILSGTYRNYDNYKSGDGTEIQSSFEAYDYSAKINYNLVKNHTIKLSFRQSFARDVMHAGLPMDALEDNGIIAAIDYKWNVNSSFLSEINTKFYGSIVDHLMTNEFRPNSKFALAISPVSSETYGGKLEFVLTPSKKLFLYSGFDSKFIGKDGQRNREVYINACSGVVFEPALQKVDLIWQNSQTTNFGAFSEFHYFANKKIIVSGGIRADMIQSKALEVETDFLEFYNGNILPEQHTTIDFFSEIKYSFSKEYNISLSAGKASRTPDLLELFINHSSVGQDAYEYLGNPGLLPEKNMQTDFIISRTGSVFSIYTDFFYSKITDFITAQVDENIPRKFLACKEPFFTKQFINIDNAYQYGFDAGFVLDINKNIYVRSNTVYTYAQNMDTDEPLPEISPLSINTVFGYKREKMQIEISDRYAFAQTRVAETFGEQESSEFNILNFSILYSPLDWLGISFGVDNILDENYYEHTSRAYKNMSEQIELFEPGRNFKFSVKFNF